MVERVCVFPCGGIKKTESTVARIAAYIVNEELIPKKTMILCVPAFLRGVEEDLVMVEDYPTIVIDCHEENCGTNLLYRSGITPAARIFIPDLAIAEKLSYGENRRELDPQGAKLSAIVARETAKVASAMLESSSYQFPRQKLNTQACIAQGSLPKEPFHYVEVATGIYRPREMPDFFMEGGAN